MEFRNYLYLVYKQKFLMLATSLIAVALTMSMTKHLPESFTSKARMATGFEDQTQASVLEEKLDAGETKIGAEFDNLIQTIQLKKNFDQVSYQLILHDLTSPTPFRKKSKMLSSLSKQATNHAIEVFTKKYQDRDPLFLFDADQKTLDDLINSMGYGFDALKNKMSISRNSNSDFLTLEFEGDNPLFCAFVINTLCKEFLTYYTIVLRESHVKGVNFLEALLQQKRESMNARMDSLKAYKIRNRILNFASQAAGIYSQISEFEAKKEEAEKSVISYQGAVKSIENKFDPNDRMYIESTLIKINGEIMETKENLKRFKEALILNKYNPKIQHKVDSLQIILAAQITQLSDKYIVNPLASKENLVSQKIGLEIQMELAKNSIDILDKHIALLNERYDRMVPHEAIIQRYETEIDIASKEYIEILTKYNQTKMESNITPKIRQIEMAMPGPAAPSKKSVFIVLSGVVPIVLYVIVLFVVFVMDDTLKTSKELSNKTNIPVLGYLPLINKNSINLENVWKSINPNKNIQNYKDLLRSTRFEIEQEMNDSKILSITSLSDNEGKSFVSLSLAYAFAKVNKLVLLIDGDFTNTSVTDISKCTLFLDDYLDGIIGLDVIFKMQGIQILGTRRRDGSLFEMHQEHYIKEKLDALKSVFDIIIIDIPSLDDLNKSKEWIVMSEKVISVYQAQRSITGPKDLQLNYLRELNEKYIGFILNKVEGHKSKLKNFIINMKSRYKNRKKK